MDDWHDEMTKKHEKANYEMRQIVLDFITEAHNEVQLKTTKTLNVLSALEKIVYSETNFTRIINDLRKENEKRYQDIHQEARRGMQHIERMLKMYFENNAKIEEVRILYSGLKFSWDQVRQILPKCPTCGAGLLQFHSDGSIGRCMFSACPTNQKEEEEA